MYSVSQPVSFREYSGLLRDKCLAPRCRVR